MKVTIEPTKHQWRSPDGTPVRMWHGRTEGGDPVLLVVVGMAAPDGAVADEHLQAVPRSAPPPVSNMGPNGRTVLSAGPNGEQITYGWWWI
jgi:hypothetical protein